MPRVMPEGVHLTNDCCRYTYIHSTKVDFFESKFIKVTSNSLFLDIQYDDDIWIYKIICIYIYGMYMIYPHLLPRRRVDNNALCVLADGFIGKP